jgi:hypothetical protein
MNAIKVRGGAIFLTNGGKHRAVVVAEFVSATDARKEPFLY